MDLRLKKISWLIIPIFLLIAMQFVISNIKVLKFPAQDFEVFYLSGKQVIYNENPYIRLGKDITRNPPPALLLFILFQFLPISLSQLIWFIASLVLFGIGSYILFKAINYLDKDKFFHISNWKLWFLYFSLVFSFFPFRHNLGSGQINNLLFLLLTLTFYLSILKKEFLAGFSLALAIVLKITPVFLLYTLLIQSKIRIALWNIIWLIVINIITYILLGSQVYKDYFGIPSSFFDFNVASYYNQSFSGFLIRALHNPTLTKVISILSLTISSSFLLFLQTKLKARHFLIKELILWNISILYILIFAPFAWQYHFVILIFPLVTTAYLGYKMKLSYKFLSALFLAYLLTALNIKNPDNYSKLGFVGSIIISHVFFGTILLLFLNYYIVRYWLKSQK